MIGRRVVGPDGRRWRVRRRWLPWEPRVRGDVGFDVDAASGTFHVFGEFVQGPFTFVLAILAALVVGVLITLVTPLVFLAAEVLLVVVLLPAFVLVRIVWRKPWIIIATTTDPPRARLSRKVQGWRESAAVIDELAAELRARPFDQWRTTLRRDDPLAQGDR